MMLGSPIHRPIDFRMSNLNHVSEKQRRDKLTMVRSFRVSIVSVSRQEARLNHILTTEKHFKIIRLAQLDLQRKGSWKEAETFSPEPC